MLRRPLLTVMLCPAVALLAASAARATEPAPAKTEFVPLADFTIDLPPEPGRHRPGYVIVGLTIEALPAAAAALKAIVPRIREAVLTRLLDLSAHGEMQSGRTDPLAIKDALLLTVQRLQPDGVRDVLITRIFHG